MTVQGEIIRSEDISSVHFPTYSGTIITLNHITYTPRCNSNLILLGQLRELGITYYDYPTQMILKQGGNTIESASRHKNFFVLNTKASKKAMIV